MFSFAAKKSRVDIAKHLRRICDCTSPNNGTAESGVLERKENRYNRLLPAIIWLWDDDRPNVVKHCTAVTKDLTDRGVGLILPAPLAGGRKIVVCLPSSDDDRADPWFFLGEVVRGRALGAGYWVVGVEMVELLNNERPETIEPLRVEAVRLLSAATLAGGR